MLRSSDKVIMVNCPEAEKYREMVWEVWSDPWNLYGTEVVLLKGKPGGFATRYLKKQDKKDPPYY